jgi:hypothetical protein
MAQWEMGGRPVVVVHVAWASIADRALGMRAWRAFRRHVRGIDVVLAALARDGTTQFVGRPDHVQALQGMSLADFKWRAKALD